MAASRSLSRVPSAWAVLLPSRAGAAFWRPLGARLPGLPLVALWADLALAGATWRNTGLFDRFRLFAGRHGLGRAVFFWNRRGHFAFSLSGDYRAVMT